MAEVSADILSELSRWLEKENPDFLIILGDRFEMLAASQAAFLTQVPIIHIGGGYETAGAIDDQIRHAITHLSTVHLAATEKCRKRIIGLLGNEKNVHLTGAPDLEILSRVETMSKESFYDSCNLVKDKPFVLVTLHPETLASEEENEKFVSEFEKFLLSIDEQILITAPCADPGSELIFKMIDSLKEQKSSVTYNKWAEVLEGADALINLSGRTVNCRYNQKNKNEIYQSRLLSTKALGEAMKGLKEPPNVWLNASSATIYAYSNGEQNDEKGAVGEGFSVDVCQKWEEAFNEHEIPGVRKVCLRTAMVIGKDGPFLDLMTKIVQFKVPGLNVY